MSALLHDLLLRLDQWHATLQQLGWVGVLGYAIGLVVLQMAFVPLAVFGVAAGAIFGFWKGVIAITIGTNMGAAINFLISRYVARGAVSRYLSHHEKFRLIDAAIGREGGKIVALLRLCPMPFGLCNYAYGLTAIRFWPYFIATFLSIIPANCFFVWIGASAHDLAAASSADHSHQTGKYILLGVGAIAGICALNYIARIAKAAVSKGEPAAVDQAPVA
ncbi:SNARE associated Golgi protein [Chthoniobacter flavus Ellin428]|uniref:TVP38/TMEM64 family membrane protein n=1 Tax=Chthoniobacter flavus Ellin428 TaxID=497964 RepID=B4D9W5_9BACT|nr:TVP38/TMEM64 family protein [Chthoniobacter flavus]EDY16779.1 SNARE associated Golgi protein [Chthoniobacter flavus Ellin428]TCO86701.1 putative membrane protein YdjX (TVP38/TMEM64 family) [Chthoniobacter flavus]